MAAYSDPEIDARMALYFGSNDNPRYLYLGSYDDIIKKLKDWVPRRLEADRRLMAFREESQAISNAVIASHGTGTIGSSPTTMVQDLQPMDHAQVCFYQGSEWMLELNDLGARQANGNR